MSAEDIEKAAHYFMQNSRTIGEGHSEPVEAIPVESYVAPADIEFTGGQYGPQLIKKGSWVLCVKVLDDVAWKKVVDGEYQAFSVGGFGTRT
jgi:hypothetical protein